MKTFGTRIFIISLSLFWINSAEAINCPTYDLNGTFISDGKSFNLSQKCKTINWKFDDETAYVKFSGKFMGAVDFRGKQVTKDKSTGRMTTINISGKVTDDHSFCIKSSEVSEAYDPNDASLKDYDQIDSFIKDECYQY